MFSENLKNVMKSQGITQTRLSELTGMSKQTVNAWCQGKKVPRSKTLIMLCGVLQCPLRALIDPDESEIREELVEVVYRLTETQLKQLLDYARYLESR